MVKCDLCGRDVDMPFRCNYCGGYFCSNHRLPEFHDCPGLQRGGGAVNYGRDTFTRPTDYFGRASFRRTRIGSLFRFSERELRDLGIGLLIMAAIPLMLFRGSILVAPWVVLGAIVIFAAAFLLHELAHKFAAQRLGYWAEFRLDPLGLFITVLSFFSPFILVAPGAVMIAGLMHRDDYGKISLAGPVTNIVQALFFLAMGLLFPHSIFSVFSYVGVTINSSLALFNLIPFGVFDGVKIMRWDTRIWLAATGTALILYLYSAL